MQAPSPPPNSGQHTHRLFWWVLAVSVALALIPTVWPELDLAAAALFAGPMPTIASVSWTWVELINLYVPALFRGILFLALALWLISGATGRAKQWRMQLAFVVVAGALGPGLVVNSGFKEHWQRARPYQVENFGGPQKFTRATVMTDQCNNNCSFVSGHAACGFFLASLMLVHRRRQYLWAAGGTLAGWIIGFARMSDSAHWLSDVLWAGPITLMCSWLVWKILQRIYSAPGARAGTI